MCVETIFLRFSIPVLTHAILSADLPSRRELCWSKCTLHRYAPFILRKLAHADRITSPTSAEAFLKNSDLAASLKGLIIGNGWFSAREQYPAYLDYLVDEELITKGSQDYINIDNAVIRCKEAIASIDAKNGASGRGVILIPICEEILGVITEATKKQCVCLSVVSLRQVMY